MKSCSSFPGKLCGQHELHSFELSMCGISSLGSRMELGTNSSAKKNPGTMGLGPAALCQLLSSQNIGAQGALSRGINDVLWILPLRRTQRKFPYSDSIRILRRRAEIPGNSLSPLHYSTFHLARTSEGLFCFKGGESPNTGRQRGRYLQQERARRCFNGRVMMRRGGDGRIQGSL